MSTRLLARLTLACLLLLGFNFGARASYSILDLGTLGGQFSEARAINNLGQVVGAAATSQALLPFLYSAGQMISIAPPGTAYGTATSINDVGQVTIHASPIGGPAIPGRGYLFSQGQLTDIGTLGGSYSSAISINRHGVVVGDSFLPGDMIRRGISFSGGTLTDLAPFVVASDINASGQIVGGTGGKAALYSGGSILDLGTLGGAVSFAIAINDAGQVVGRAQTGTGQTHAFLYSGGSMTDLGTLGGSFSHAWDINAVGQVVGSAAKPSLVPGAMPPEVSHAFLYENGTMIDLNTLLPPGSSFRSLDIAFGINDFGAIAGSGTRLDGSVGAFVLTPVPEPQTHAMLLAGLGILCAALRSRNRPAVAL
ncbi:MAG: DUF3466 family protein [Burkholderiales bacterium]|nr:DUF3466 family protein [Burkholderiales bacterium]